MHIYIPTRFVSFFDYLDSSGLLHFFKNADSDFSTNTADKSLDDLILDGNVYLHEDTTYLFVPNSAFNDDELPVIVSNVLAEKGIASVVSASNKFQPIVGLSSIITINIRCVLRDSNEPRDMIESNFMSLCRKCESSCTRDKTYYSSRHKCESNPTCDKPYCEKIKVFTESPEITVEKDTVSITTSVHLNSSRLCSEKPCDTKRFLSQKIVNDIREAYTNVFTSTDMLSRVCVTISHGDNRIWYHHQIFTQRMFMYVFAPINAWKFLKRSAFVMHCDRLDGLDDDSDYSLTDKCGIYESNLIVDKDTRIILVSISNKTLNNYEWKKFIQKVNLAGGKVIASFCEDKLIEPSLKSSPTYGSRSSC